VANIGDIDGDGNTDIAVGQGYAETLWIIMLTKQGLVKSRKRIYEGMPGFDKLPARTFFGIRVCGLGDLDGDGVRDVMAASQDTGYRGNLWTLFLNSDGSLKSYRRIIPGVSPDFPDTVNYGGAFGSSLDAIGDLDGDSIMDVAVGHPLYKNASGKEVGRVHILFMNRDGSIKARQVIDSNNSNLGAIGERNYFGIVVFRMGDFNKDGIPDLGATMPEFDYVFPGGLTKSSGIFYILNLNGVPVKTSTGDVIKSDAQDFYVYPNPASDRLYVRSKKNQSIVRITLTDVSGRVCLSQNVNGTGSSIETRQLAPGTYQIQISDGTSQQSIQFIKH
jgi:hypothetical protein